MATPIPIFPGAIATDEQLRVANNRIRTTLRKDIDGTETVIPVQSTAGFRPNSLATIGAEIMAVEDIDTACCQALIVSRRGFDGTIATAHSAGAQVLGNIVAWHHNVLATEIEAIEAALGVHLGNVGNVPPINLPRDWCMIPGGSLTPGTQSITLSPVPLGVNGSNRRHYLWISGGNGPSEAVRIQGGTAVSGAPSGTVVVNCVYAHSGAWSICSATAGIQEAVELLAAAGHGGTVWIPEGRFAIHAPITIDWSGINLRGAGIGATVLTADLAVSPVIQIGTGTLGVCRGN